MRNYSQEVERTKTPHGKRDLNAIIKGGKRD